MAKYSEDRKREAREDILKHAAERFRRDGIAAVGVRPLMADAGLTHGGFYAHFGSRSELIAAALEYAAGTTLDYFHAAIARVPDDEKLAKLVATYLRPVHRDHMELGCTVSALAPEIARESDETRERFSASNEGLINLIAEHLPHGGRDEERLERARILFASMLGVLQLMRIETDPATAASLARAGRTAAMQLAHAPWREDAV